MTDSRFPTMDGSTSTTVIDYNSQGLTGTIPTEFGFLTLVTSLSLANNTLSGEIPTGTFERQKVGTPHRHNLTSCTPHDLLSPTRRPPTHPSTTSLRSVAAELGALVLLDTTFSLASNDLTSTIPTGKYTLGSGGRGAPWCDALRFHTRLSSPRPLRCHPFQSSANS